MNWPHLWKHSPWQNFFPAFDVMHKRTKSIMRECKTSEWLRIWHNFGQMPLRKECGGFANSLMAATCFRFAEKGEKTPSLILKV